MRAYFLTPVFIAGLLISAVTGAYTLEQYKFESLEKETEFRTLLEELRCVVCQNETLAGSQADVTQIMREEVYRLTQEGQSEKEIKAHLVDRYGDFVLYDPPLKASTIVLWFGPFLLIAGGGFFLFRALLNKKKSADSELSNAERARLQALLAEPSDSQETKK